MSMISKLVVRNVHTFGVGQMVEMSCLCDNDLMRHYAENHKDKLFTEYSPWGEMKLHQPSGYSLGPVDAAYYVMVVAKHEVEDKPPFPGASAFCQLRVVSVTDFGDGQAKTLEMCNGWQTKNHPNRGIENFNWKMSVDNPHVFESGWLKPGTEDYFVAFYSASKFDRNGAIAAVHGVV